MNAIRWQQDPDGVVVLTFDDPSRSANTVDDTYATAMEGVLDRLEAARDRISGVVLTSGKRTFFAGADLDRLVRAIPAQADEIMVSVTRVKTQLRRLETFGRPIVAALGGSALGGGLEIALACHHRIAVADPAIEIGLPEVTLGLLPGGGGVVRTVRLLGLSTALTEVLLRGQRHRPARALEIGLVHELVGTRDDLVPRARDWIAANPDVTQPWDSTGYRVPGGTPSSPALAAVLPTFPATLRAQLKGAPYPAPRHILAAAVEGAQVDLDTAFTIESRYFVDLACGQISKNMIQAFFVDLPAARSDRGLVTDRPPTGRIAVRGTGTTAAAITGLLTTAGIDVVLKDGPDEADAVVNTSSDRVPTATEDTVELRFPPPLARMPLVEVVRGEATSDGALARALATIRPLRRTPIVVTGGRGSFTGRLLRARIAEGMAMLTDGVAPASVEQASGQAGYSLPLLVLLDEIGLARHRADDVLERMTEEFGRTGRAGGAGFYDYADDVRGRLWPGLEEHFGQGRRADVPFAGPLADLIERLLVSEAIEAVRCLTDGLLTSVGDANLGSILGTGYPGWTGGALQYVTGYPSGPAGFAARARELTERYGERFAPPPAVVALAESGGGFTLRST